MRTRPNQNGDFGCACVLRGLNMLQNPRGFGVDVRDEFDRRYRTASVPARRRNRRIADLTSRRIGCGAEHPRKHGVDPVDDRHVRTKVVRELQTGDVDVIDAAGGLGVEKNAYFGLPESIDRLHRIANGE